MATTSTNVNAGAWRRWFRRSNVHIAEYILMLIMMGSFLGVLVSLWFSFFGLLYATGYEARTLAIAAAAQLASLIVVAPAAFWLYARTSGQEMVQPELTERRSHTVFLAIWMIIIVSVLVSMLIAVTSSFVQATFGLGKDDFSEAIVTKVLPSLFGVATIVFGLFAIVKHPARKLSMLTGIVLAGLSVLLLLANIIMVVVRKDEGTTKTGGDCTFSRYTDDECSYSEYLRDSRGDRSESLYNSGSDNSRLQDMFTPHSF